MVVSLLMSSVPPGSYLAIYHLASDLDPALEEAARQWSKMMPLQPITLPLPHGGGQPDDRP